MAWTDDPLTAGSIFYNKVHYTELHYALWTLYTDAGLTSDDFDTWKVGIFSEFYTDEIFYKPYIRNDWIEEIRIALENESFISACGYSDKADMLNDILGQDDWTDPILVAEHTFIRNDHIEELRQVMDNLTPETVETFEPAEVKEYLNSDNMEAVDKWRVYTQVTEKIYIGENEETLNKYTNFVSLPNPANDARETLLSGNVWKDENTIFTGKVISSNFIISAKVKGILDFTSAGSHWGYWNCYFGYYVHFKYPEGEEIWSGLEDYFYVPLVGIAAYDKDGYQSFKSFGTYNYAYEDWTNLQDNLNEYVGINWKKTCVGGTIQWIRVGIIGNPSYWLGEYGTLDSSFDLKCDDLYVKDMS